MKDLKERSDLNLNEELENLSKNLSQCIKDNPQNTSPCNNIRSAIEAINNELTSRRAAKHNTSKP
ncbi:TPA: hypothetical protein L7W01_005362 [Klebsiella variicola subsp. variicola]|nr:hypothetical protein [Klebsiella variicola subsp. variicola]HBZ7348456.1 hypothetical protein [Klebsiella variicola subsp. variicola]